MDHATQRLLLLNEVARIATADLELRPMLQRIADTLRRRCDWEFVACVSVDHDRGRFVCEAVSTDLPTDVHPGYSRELGSGVVGQVALTGEAILLDDVTTATEFVHTLPGVRSELCMPVRHGGRTLAVLNLESRRAAAFRDQYEMLQTVADQIGGAIASAHLYDQLRRRARLLEMVSEVSRTALEAGDLDSLLGSIVDYILEHFPVSSAVIMMVDEDRRSYELTAQAGSSAGHHARGTRWPATEGIVGRAIRTGEDQLVLDVRADPEYLAVDPGAVSAYALPIRLGQRIVGVLNLEGHTPDAVTGEHLTVFRTFASQLAGAIHLATVNRALEASNAALRQANQRLARLSARDPLTGIANRRRFDTVFAREWRRSARAGTPLGLLIADIDHFKLYNDRYGHRRGDRALRSVARAIRAAVRRSGELVARYGGEEFAVLLPGVEGADAVAAAERVRAAVAALALPHEASPLRPIVTISVGAASTRPHPRLGSDALIEAADRALYEAKAGGRDRVCAAGVPHDRNATDP
jgi:diguanylate cyclase (GGDEF)-like protein